jgi:hypothetical protein
MSRVQEDKGGTLDGVTGAELWMALFVVVVPVVSGIWAVSGQTGLAPFLILPALLGAILVARFPDEAVPTPLPVPSPLPQRLSVATIATAPAVGLFVQLSGGDFPFLGDSDYHLAQTRIAAVLWLNLIGLTIAVLIAVCFAAKRRSGWWLLALLAVAAPLLGLMVREGYTFPVRYPGTFYFFAAPVAVLPWEQPLDALRLLNLLAIPAWMLVLRPAVVGAFPGWRDLPLILFLFWQKDVVYYFTSAYLEPWMLVFVLLAVEHLIRHGEVAGWKPLLLLGAAAMVKEQAFFVLPFVGAGLWLAGPREKRWRIVLATSVASAPFLVYMIARRSTGITRTLSAAPLGDMLSPDRLLVWAGSMATIFGPALVVVLLLIGAVAVGAFRGARRFVYLSLGCAAVFQVAMFFFDRASMPWTGYARFHLVPIVILGAPLFEISRRTILTPKRAVVAVAVLVAAMHAVPLATMFRDARDPVRLNFFEFAPIVYPVREALRAGEARGVISPGDPLRLVTDLPLHVLGYDLSAFEAGYPRLGHRLVYWSEEVDTSACACRSDAVLALFSFPSDYDRRSVNVRAEAAQFAEQCRAAAERSCGRIATVTRDGTLVALVGSGAGR